MANFTVKKRRQSVFKLQRGDFLLESLIGMVLMAIIGMGVVFVTSRVATSQKDMRLQEIAINQLRAALIRNGTNNYNVCNTLPVVLLPNSEEVTVEAQGCSTSTTATINGVSVNVPRPIILSATSTSLGEIVVGGTWVTP